MNATRKNLMLAEATANDPRWAALRARDPAADGQFFYSVRSTGVYCRPSCAARPARPENVAFHPSAADAERAGFRPCKPDQPARSEQHAALVTGLCRFIPRSASRSGSVRWAPSWWRKAGAAFAPS